MCDFDMFARTPQRRKKLREAMEACTGSEEPEAVAAAGSGGSSSSQEGSSSDSGSGSDDDKGSKVRQQQWEATQPQPLVASIMPCSMLASSPFYRIYAMLNQCSVHAAAATAGRGSPVRSVSIV